MNWCCSAVSSNNGAKSSVFFLCEIEGHLLGVLYITNPHLVTGDGALFCMLLLPRNSKGFSTT